MTENQVSKNVSDTGKVSKVDIPHLCRQEHYTGKGIRLTKLFSHIDFSQFIKTIFTQTSKVSSYSY